MKTHLTALFVSAILIATIGSAPSFAQIVDPVTVTTDKTSYANGDKILVTGKVVNVLQGDISMRVVAPNGNTVGLGQFSVGPDRTFSAELTAGGPLWKSDGTYTVIVQYGNHESTTEFGFTGAGSGSGSGTVPGDAMETFPVDAGEQGTFSVSYSITGGSITSITASGESNSLVIMIDATDDGELTITLPRDVIDARMDVREGDDDQFYVLVDGEERDFEETKTDTDRTLTIGFFADSEEIEIIGTWAIPEFGTIAALILATAVAAIIAVSARSRLSIMPKY